MKETAARTLTRQGAPIACFITEDGEAWGLQWTPENVDISGVTWDYATIDRQGRKPLVRPKSANVRTMSFTHPVLAAGSSAAVATRVVEILISLAESGQKVRLINVSQSIETRGWWYIDGLTVRIKQRETDQQIKVAELSWSLIEANDERPKIAKVPPPPPPPPPPAVAAAPAATQSDYTVKKGDSLWKIAANLLGSGPRWKEIYDLNQASLNLAAPEMYRGLLTVWIYPGQVMKIPAR